MTDNGTNMVMPVAPTYNGMGGGFGDFGGSGWWIILLFIVLGGWGNGFGGGYGDGGLYPWMNQAEITTNGFQNAQLGNQLTAVQSDLGDIQTQLCNGFAGVEQGANARQIANMQQAFAAQTAVTGAISDLASQQASCCCENRLATCQTQNVIAREAADTRYANATNTRDIIQSQTNGTQTILDKLCSLELNAKQDRINDLERQLTMANLAASQNAQTATILANNEAQTTALEQYLAPVPRPAYVVQNPNCCGNTCGTNCGCGF